MSDPVTKEALVVGLGEVREEMRGVEQRLDARIDGLEQRLDARIDGLEQRLDARIDGLEQRLEERYATKVELQEMEARLTYQIAHSANAVIERMVELVKPFDDKASQALSETRGTKLALDEHVADPDAHSS